MARNRLNVEGTVLGLVGEDPRKRNTPTAQSANLEQSDPKREDGQRGRKKKEEVTKPYTIHLTPEQNRAITMRIALSDRPEDKDRSSIVRAALDAYLEDMY